MIVAVLKGFIKRCDKKNITPTEDHVDVYLEKLKMPQYRDAFIRFCLHGWDERHYEDLEEIFFYSIMRRNNHTDENSDY